MRKSERRAKAFEALLLLAQKGSLTISGRGIDEKGHNLYQVTQYGGGIVCVNVTEEQLISHVLKGEATK